jgi:hypothetical protein
VDWHVLDYYYTGTMALLVSSLRLQEARAQLINHSKTTDEESEDEYDQYNGIPVASCVTINKARAFLETRCEMSFRYIDKKLFAIDSLASFIRRVGEKLHESLQPNRLYSLVRQLTLSYKETSWSQTIPLDLKGVSIQTSLQLLL